LVVVSLDQPRPMTLLPPHSSSKPEAATAVYKLLMMGKRMPETCWAVFKRQEINLGDWCIWLVDLFELPVLQLMQNKSAAMQNTKIEHHPTLTSLVQNSLFLSTVLLTLNLFLSTVLLTLILFLSTVLLTVSENSQKSLLHANMLALLQLTALCIISAHNVPISTTYKICKAPFCINIFKWCTE